MMVVLAVGFCLSVETYGQSPGYGQHKGMRHWVFGSSNNNLQFNRVTAKPTVFNDQASPFGNGGSATCSDPVTGNLLFYTDGNNVYDFSHRSMPNGTGLGGAASSNQPAAICPVPGQPDKYFVFTNSATPDAAGSISYAVVDMGRSGNAVLPAPPAGEVESKNQPTGLNGVSEAMLIIPKPDGLGFWLITQERGTRNYSSTNISAASYTGGGFITSTFSGLGLPMNAAHFAWHKASRKLAVAPSSEQVDAVIFNIDDATGAITFDQFIFNSAGKPAGKQAIYDLEWSAGGNFLYLSVLEDLNRGGNGDVLQYDLSNPTNTLTSVLPASVSRSYGLQMGNDSLLYHLYQKLPAGPILLGRIEKPDTVAAGVRYNAAPFGPQDWAGTQFPALVPLADPQFNLSFEVSGDCQKSPIFFYPKVTPVAERLEWDFGDGQFSSAWNPAHSYETGTSFSVTMTAFLNGFSKSVTQSITLKTFSLELQVTSDTTACKSEFPPPRGSNSPKAFSVEAKAQGGGTPTYVWSNGDTGAVLTPDSAGYYYVVATDPASGCKAYAGVNVKEYGLQDQRSNVWYFGTKAGIDFNVQPPAPLDDSAMDAPEGCAVVGDRNGRVIFYTDGDKVFDRLHNQIAVGIGGDPASAQSALIMSLPDDETLYYIFTTQANRLGTAHTLFYSLFDLKENGGLGAVVKQKIPLFNRSTERITANENWLIAHEYGNNSFRSYRVTSTGIANPIITSIGSEHSYLVPEQAEGCMKIGPRNNIAVPVSKPGSSNQIEIFQLIDSTGVITNYRKVNLNEPTGKIYGIEFSPGGNKLFASIQGASSKIFEYFLDSINAVYFRNSVVNSAKIGALQLAPDGQIYIAKDGESVLGTILVSEDTTRASGFNFNAFNLKSGSRSRLGLPNFIQQTGNAFGGPALSYSDVCIGDPITFAAVKTDAIDNVLWSFGDGASALEDTVTHVYAAPNIYAVTLGVTNRCGLDTTLVQKVRVSALPARPTIFDQALCTTTLVLNANQNGVSGLTYSWSTGSSAPQITVDTPGAYGVIAEDPATGCSNDAIVLITDNRPQFDLGPNRTVCEKVFVSALDLKNPGAVYEWSINGVASSPSSLKNIDTAVPGDFRYIGKVTDPITNCFKQDTTVISVKPSPVISAVAKNADCTANSGIMEINISPPGVSFSWFLFQGSSLAKSEVAKPAGLYTVNGLATGSYFIEVVDDISGCATTLTKDLSQNKFNLAATGVGSCNNTGSIALTPTPPGGFSVTVFDLSSTPPLARDLTGLAAGFYNVEINSGGCVESLSNIEVPVLAEVDVVATQNCAGPPVTISATSTDPGTIFNWNGPLIAPGITGSSIQVNPGQGTFSYTVTASVAGKCSKTETVLVAVANPVIKADDVCQDLVRFSPTDLLNDFNYTWSIGTSGTRLGSSIQLDKTFNGQNLVLTMKSGLTGCSFNSAPLAVNVVGEIDVALASTPPCQDGQPIVITSTVNRSDLNFEWFRKDLAIPGSVFQVIAGAVSSSLSASLEGEYRITATKSGCNQSADIGIRRAPLPKGILPARVVICNDPANTDPLTSAATLDPGDFLAYDWLKDGIALGIFNRVLVANQDGEYLVKLTNSFLCRAEVATDVVNECTPVVEAPNAFKPSSGVALNTNFFIVSKFITGNFRVYIYNRWGELVFQSSDPAFQWNGGYDNEPGRPLPGGTYAYVVEYINAFRPEDGIQQKRGGVLLIR